MDEKLKSAIQFLNAMIILPRGAVKIDKLTFHGDGIEALKLILNTLTHLYEQELPEILHNNITPGFVEEQFPKGKCKERGQALVLHAKMLIWFNDFTARLYEQPEGLKKREPSEINGNLFVSIEMYNNIFNQAIDLAIPIVNKLKSELEQAKLKISELENTDNLRREMLEEARKELAELKRKKD